MMGTDLAAQPRTRPNPGWDLARVRAAIQEHVPHEDGVMLSVPVAAVDAVSALRHANVTPAFYWRPSRPGHTVVGWDAAAVLHARGNDRFTVIRDRAQALLQSLRYAALNSETGYIDEISTDLVEPRLFGGFAFQPEATQHPIWAGFDDATLLLPRWRYLLAEGSTATLSLTLTSDELRNDRNCEQWLQRLQHLHAVFADLASAPKLEQLGTPAAPPAVVDTGSPETWNGQIQSILTAIQRGQCSKVVLARRSQHSFSRPLSLAATLDALQARNGEDVTCFAFDLGQGAFVGATPETLISKIGPQLTSEALAGSVTSTDPDGAHRLLDSGKDRDEHRVVVQAIVDALKPLCSRVSFDAEPRIRRLRHLLHLWTPIVAQLAAPKHVLDLVSLLHPTPAVGGTPTDWATHWITENETVPRGWYASPVGWFNAAGDGAFHVALRSGVLRGKDAFLYAGSGVVAKSDAKAELAETELKLASLLDALRSE
jgi:menaquinone-specific isochorismate synthase